MHILYSPFIRSTIILQFVHLLEMTIYFFRKIVFHRMENACGINKRENESEGERNKLSLTNEEGILELSKTRWRKMQEQKAQVIWNPWAPVLLKVGFRVIRIHIRRECDAFCSRAWKTMRRGAVLNGPPLMFKPGTIAI